MTRLTLAKLVLLLTALVAVLNLIGIMPILTYMLPVLMLALFIYSIDLLHTVLVLAKNLNESYTFLQESDLYQMEVET